MNLTKCRDKSFRLRLLVYMLTLSLVVGCATPKVKTLEKSDIHMNVQFLRDGITTREDILLKLGEPSGQFEGERILTYVVTVDGDGDMRVLPRQFVLNSGDPRTYRFNPSVCSLVLVFGGDNVLLKHSLVGAGEKLK